MKIDLKDKVIIVTGGSGGIGSAIINELSNSGATIVSVYHQNPVNEKPAINIFYMQTNLLEPEEWEKLLSYTLKNFGRIDILINSAGVLEPGEFSLLQKDKLNNMIDLNFTSILVGIQKTIAIMMKQGYGQIINIGSLGGIVPMPYSAVYSATKFALRGFSFSLAEELKGTGINISLITPGSVKTKMLNYEAKNEYSSISFLSKPISVEKVANAVLKLIHKPKVELIIPRSQAIPSKLLVFSPRLFSELYKILHRIGISAKKKYLLRF